MIALHFMACLLLFSDFSKSGTVSRLQHAFLEELERTVALLAFEDTASCPVGELLDISQRQKTASELNAAILTSQSHEKGRLLQNHHVL